MSVGFRDRPVSLLPLRHGVLFPGVTATLPVGRARSVALVKGLSAGDSVVIAAQIDRQLDDPSLADLHPVAVLAKVVRITPERKHFHLVVEGMHRVRLERLARTEPYLQVDLELVPEPVEDALEAQALAESLLEKLRAVSPSVSPQLQTALREVSPASEPGRVADLVAGALGLGAEREVEVLLTLPVVARLRVAHRVLAEAEQLQKLRSKISREMSEDLNSQQREALLRQQLKAIQKELGQADASGDALRDRLAALELPPEVREVVDRELGRLGSVPGEQAEAGVIRRYLELIAELPWSARAEVKDDLDAVRVKLDADHHGLTEVKKRILEHLAVRKMTGTKEGAILCLVGPPGVGKTSLGQSIADATGRPFVRVSLGGVRDEAEIRGHRRTYVGALPGRILHALRKAKVKNPVLLLDEVDKLGQGWMGSPEAALLEVLDPEQNHTFTDHYLELPFDLSEVLFVCTANTLETVSPPLRDRLEIIALEGYTIDEKLEIARRHLVPKELLKHGLAAERVALSDEALSKIIADYTREAGVRQLTRELRKICRAVTLTVASHVDSKPEPVRVEPGALVGYLGKQKFWGEVAERTSIVGVATGLAWTPMGGDVLFVETSRMTGHGAIEITGQLGDVMKESARAALTYLRSHAEELGIEPAFLEKQDVHVHVPAGGVPKDGPSAGVTMFTALASLFTGRRVRPDTAMTGECTLRGRVLPVGGIKAKVLAAHRAGLTRVILPRRNEVDLDDLPPSVRESLSFFPVDDMQQVLAQALEEQARPPEHEDVGAGIGAQAPV